MAAMRSLTEVKLPRRIACRVMILKKISWLCRSRHNHDLRHSGVTWRLNSGVPAAEVAAWAGHSVEVLTRVYVRCVAGLEDVWISRMDGALRLQSGQDTEEEQ
jgi:integrase